MKINSHTGSFLVFLSLLSTGHKAIAQITPEQLQQALKEARLAVESAQAAAAAAQAALATMQQQAQSQAEILAKAHETRAITPPASQGNIVTGSGYGLGISGYLDVGVTRISHTDKSRDKTELTTGNTGTTLINFTGFKNFGDEYTASFLFELDPNPTQSSTANGSAAANAFRGTPFAGQQYIALSGKFGELKLGTPNSGSLSAGITSQPFGTGIGSGYSPGFGRMGGSAVSGISQFTGNTIGRIIRHEKTVMYSTQRWNGLKASIEYAPGNSNSPSLAGNSNRYTSFTAYYNKGNANLVFSHSMEKAGALGAAGPASSIGTVGNAVLPSNSHITWSIVGANYALGPVTVYGGYSRTRHKPASGNSLEDSNSWNIASRIRVTPKLSLAANFLKRKSNITNIASADLYAIGADYLFDSGVTAYLRLEGLRFDATGTSLRQKQNTFSSGIAYRF